MPKIKRNTVPTAFSVLPRHLEIIQHFIEDKGTFTSASDVVRKALEFFHDKSYPAYIFHLNPAALDKKARQETSAAIAAIPDEQFATENLKAMVVKDAFERKFFIIYWFLSKEVAHFPLEGVKEWAEANKAAVDAHLSFAKEKPITEFDFSPYVKTVFEREYGIILP